MVQINLRQADALKRNIAQFIKSCSPTNAVNISVYESNIGSVIATAKQNFTTNLQNRIRLEGILASIKFAVGGVNDSSGVDQLLNEREKNKSILSVLTDISNASPAPSPTAIDAQIKAQLKRNEINEYSARDTVTVLLLDQATIDDIKGQVVAIKRRQNEISDALLVTNLNKSVIINDDDYKFLQNLGIV